MDEEQDCLDVYFDQLEPLSILAGEIRRCIIDEDEISDDARAVPLKHTGSIQTNDKAYLCRFAQQRLSAYLSADAIITMRGDRYCLPVKAEYRFDQVQGMIHDQSFYWFTLLNQWLS